MPPNPEQNDLQKQQSDEFDRLLNSLAADGPEGEKLSPDIQQTMRIAIPKESDWLARAPKLDGATQSVPIMRQEERIPLPAPSHDIGNAGTAEHPTAAHKVNAAPPVAPPPEYQAPVPAPPPRAALKPQPQRPAPRPAPVYAPQQPVPAAPVALPRASGGQQKLLAALLVFAIFLLIALSAVLYFDLRLPSAG